jgi:group I intron endonuclease
MLVEFKDSKYKSGIYQITNLVNNKFYIGSSTNLYKRFHVHKSKLINKTHPNIKLQNSINKYGINNFKFEVLAICPKEYIVKLEQFFLDSLKPNYNISPTAENNLGCKHERRSEISKEIIINILNDYKELSQQDLVNKYHISKSTICGILYNDEVSTEIKKEINYKKFKNRKPISGINNKKQILKKEEIEKIAELYNTGLQPIEIAKKLYNNEKYRYTISRISRGVGYKEYYYLFNKEISYHGKQKQY